MCIIGHCGKLFAGEYFVGGEVCYFIVFINDAIFLSLLRYVGFIVSGIAGSDQRTLMDLMHRVINFKFTDDISGDCIFLDLGNENIVNFKAGRCLAERPYICKVKAGLQFFLFNS